MSSPSIGVLFDALVALTAEDFAAFVGLNVLCPFLIADMEPLWSGFATHGAEAFPRPMDERDTFRPWLMLAEDELSAARWADFTVASFTMKVALETTA